VISIVEPTQSTYNANPFATGQTIQAEHYDRGGEGVAYHDNTANNEGGSTILRGSEGVDLKLISGSTTNYRVNQTFPGEWFEYTVNVATAGSYNMDFRVSSKGTGGTFHAELRNPSTDQLISSLTGALTIPNTAANDTFVTVSKNVTLPAGRNVIRLSMDQASSYGTIGNFDWLKISPITTTTPTSPTAKTLTTSTAAYVRGGTYAGTNFGSATTLVVKNSTAADSIRYSYLKFDLSSVSTINSAKLRLNGKLSDTTVASLVTEIYNASSTSWTESGLTWNNKPAVGTTLRGKMTVSGTTSKWYEVDLTNFLKAEKAAGRNVVTLVLKNSTASSTQTVFASDETTTVPQLVVS
jgi:hypothetical protein